MFTCTSITTMVWVLPGHDDPSDWCFDLGSYQQLKVTRCWEKEDMRGWHGEWSDGWGWRRKGGGETVGERTILIKLVVILRCDTRAKKTRCVTRDLKICSFPDHFTLWANTSHHPPHFLYLHSLTKLYDIHHPLPDLCNINQNFCEFCCAIETPNQ